MEEMNRPEFAWTLLAAFDEVLRDTVLDMPVRAMVQLAAIIGSTQAGDACAQPRGAAASI